MATPLEIHPPSSILHPRPIFLAGPTAVGKSVVALALAEKLGGEIISVDSMQVYRGLDIGTAKSSAAERARVPHHLIDVAELTEAFDATKFVVLAEKAVGEIQSRGRVPIFCGGTGLYFKAFLEGLGEAPPADEKLRAELEAAPLANLLRELEQRDPATFAKIDRQNPRRVIRAIEVIRLTGQLGGREVSLPAAAGRDLRWGHGADLRLPDEPPGVRGNDDRRDLQGPVADRVVLQGSQAEPQDQDVRGHECQRHQDPGVDGADHDAGPEVPPDEGSGGLVAVEPRRAAANEPVHAPGSLGLAQQAV